jgi:Zn-finger nucleic acid-binding protein
VNCPHCKTAPLEFCTLDPGLDGRRCAECGGTWIPSDSYRQWRERQEADLPEQTPVASDLKIEDSSIPKLCPDCGHLLLPYRIGHGLTFALNHCGHCNGVWLDRSEWEALMARNLHDNLHEMFSAPWQRQVREEERRAAMERIYLARFGEQDYAELRRIKAWIDSHPDRSSVLAFLAASDSP